MAAKLRRGIPADLDLLLPPARCYHVFENIQSTAGERDGNLCQCLPRLRRRRGVLPCARRLRRRGTELKLKVH